MLFDDLTRIYDGSSKKLDLSS